MPGFGITYFQDTGKDTQMENCCSKSIKMCPYPYLLKPHQEHQSNIAPPLLRVQMKPGNGCFCAARNVILLNVFVI